MGERLFDGIMVGAVRSKVKQFVASILDKFFCHGMLMERRVIHDNKAFSGKFGQKNLLNPCVEQVRVACACEQQWRQQLFAVLGQQERGPRAAVAAFNPIHTLALYAPAMEARRIVFKTCFIKVNRDEAPFGVAVQQALVIFAFLYTSFSKLPRFF